MAGGRSLVPAYGLAQCAPGLVTWASRHVYTAKRNLHQIERRKRKNDLRLMFISSQRFFPLRAVFDAFAVSHVLSLHNASPFGVPIASRGRIPHIYAIYRVSLVAPEIGWAATVRSN
jgi:hypothetical protein